MPNLLDQFLSQKGRDEITWMVDSFGNIRKTMDDINSRGIKIEMDIKGAGSLKDYVDMMNKLNGYNRQFLADAQKMASIQKIEAQTRLANAKALNEENKAKEEQVKVDRQIQKETEASIKVVRKSMEELQSQTKEYEKPVAAKAKLAKDAALQETYKKEAHEAKLAAEATAQLRKEVEEAAKETQRQLKEVQKANSLYAILDKTHQKLIASAREVGVQFGYESKEFEEAANSANKVGKQLSEIDSRLGNWRRNVGNYASQWNALHHQVSQVAREIPNFAINAQTGIISLSNNLPYLADAIADVNRQNKILIAQGQPVVSVWKQIGQAIFSWQSALIVGVTLLTAYGGKIIEWFNDTSEAAKRAAINTMNFKDTVQQLKDVQDDIEDGFTRDERLLLAQARAKGVSEEEITRIEKQSINDRIKSKNEYISKLIEEQGSLENLLQIQVKSVNQKKQDVETTNKLLQETKKAKKEAENERANLQNELLVKDFNLQETLRKKAEQEDKKAETDSKRRQEEAERDRIRGLELRIGLTTKVKQLSNDQAREEIELDKRAQESILSNEQTSLDDRMAARWQYHNDVIALAEIEKLNQLENNKKEHAETNRLINSLHVSQKQKNELLALEHERFTSQRLKTISDFTVKANDALADYADKSTQDVQNSQDKLAQTIKDNLASLSKAFENNGKQFGETPDQHESKLKARLEIIRTYLSAFQEIGNAISTGLDAKLGRINKERDHIERAGQDEMDIINATMEAGEKKEEAVRNSKAKTQKELMRLDEEEKRQRIKKAIFEKGMAMTTIIVNTAIAVTEALKSNVLAVPKAIAATVLGAAQLAAVASAPIPQYYKGVRNAPAGLATVGEQGRELRVNPDGSIELTPDHATMTYLDAGTDIYTAKDTMKILSSVQRASLNGYAGSNQKERTEKILAEAYHAASDKSANKIVAAIERKQANVVQRESYGHVYNNDYYKSNFKK